MGCSHTSQSQSLTCSQCIESANIVSSWYCINGRIKQVYTSQVHIRDEKVKPELRWKFQRERFSKSVRSETVKVLSNTKALAEIQSIKQLADQGFSVSEIADKLKLPVGTVKSRANRWNITFDSVKEITWTDEIDSLLGTDTDANIALFLRTTAAAVSSRRKLIGIGTKPPERKSPDTFIGKRYAELAQTFSVAQIASGCGIDVSSVYKAIRRYLDAVTSSGEKLPEDES